MGLINTKKTLVIFSTHPSSHSPLLPSPLHLTFFSHFSIIPVQKYNALVGFVTILIRLWTCLIRFLRPEKVYSKTRVTFNKKITSSSVVSWIFDGKSEKVSAFLSIVYKLLLRYYCETNVKAAKRTIWSDVFSKRIRWYGVIQYNGCSKCVDGCYIVASLVESTVNGTLTRLKWVWLKLIV